MINDCIICDKGFIPYRPMNKTCSKECSITQVLQHKREYYQRTKDTKLKIYREKNKNIISEKRRKLYLKNKESENKKHKEWYQKNRETEIASALIREKKKWNDDPERMKKEHKAGYEKHKIKRLAHMKEYLKIPKNLAQHKKTSKVWQQNNPEKVLQNSIRYLTKLGLEFKLPHQPYLNALMSWTKSVRKLYGNHCAICGSTHGLNSHHIFPKSIHPLLSLNPNNGIPLCKEHHLEVHRLNPMVRA